MTTQYSLHIRKNVLRAALALAVIGAASFVGFKYAQSAPITMSKYFVYQGKLTQPDGSPVASNVYNLQFGVFTDASATTKICDSTHENVVVKQGVFRVAIGQGASGLTGSCGSTDMQAELASRPELWLKISVKGPSDAVYQVLSPLVQIGATPRALYAASAGRAELASGAEGDLKTYIDTLIPTGAVIAYAATTPPNGWLLCDGTPVSRTQYATLFAAVGTAHGTGDGATTFNLPDYRGRFLRGVDMGVGRDPDRAGRTAMNVGGNIKDLVGSVQSSAFETHSHSATGNLNVMLTNGSGANGAGMGAAIGGGSSFNFGVSVGVSPAGASTETRPINASVNYLIKY